ncbi:hypothetical protein [Lysinibacter cavernae]|uniref:Uncharacterized protein n=1 Tax=Lysinibacter cavernae TaxID=1640652 RepID=A0A7X5TU81_9MICO|nr:hypothetical protein [Lysinibacter cavernae]NIH54985.1 hypothetical protein [Lysinibacter cavernae]
MGIFDSARNLFSKGEQGDDVRVTQHAPSEESAQEPQTPPVPEQGGEATAKVREFAAELAETTRTFAHDVMAHIDSEIAAAGSGARTYRSAGSAPELVFAEEALAEEEAAVETELASDDSTPADADHDHEAEAEAALEAEVVEPHNLAVDDVVIDAAVADDDAAADVSDDTVLTPIVRDEIAYVPDAPAEDDAEDTVLQGDDIVVEFDDSSSMSDKKPNTADLDEDLEDTVIVGEAFRDNGDTVDLSGLRLAVEIPEDIAPAAADNADTPDILELPDEPALTFDQLLGGVNTQTQQLSIPTGTPEPEDGPDDETLNWELPSANSSAAPADKVTHEERPAADEVSTQKKGKSSRKAKSSKPSKQEQPSSDAADGDDFDNLFGDLLK